MKILVTLDNVHRELLAGIKELKEASITELSERVYLTPDAVRRRLNKLEKNKLISCQKKRKSNGKLAHFFSLNYQFEKLDFLEMQENYSDVYLSRLSENQIRACIASAIVGDGYTSEIHAISKIKYPSSSHSALTKLLKDGTVNRSEEKEKHSGYKYSFTNKVSVRDCFAEYKKRVNSGSIEKDSLSEEVENKAITVSL